MKKSDRFDEIFAQRGAQVQPENMVAGKVYLLDQKASWGTAVLHLHKSRDAEHLYRVINLFENTGCAYSSEGGCTLIEDASAFYEATPDQIELLNSYR